MIYFVVHFKRPRKRSMRRLELAIDDTHLTPGPFGVYDPSLEASRIVAASHAGKDLLASGYRMYGITRLTI